MALIEITILDPHMNVVQGANLAATSPTNGPWQGVTDCAGHFTPDLAPGHYDIKITKPGFQEFDWPTDLGSSGRISQQIQYSSIVNPTRDQIINVQGNFLNLFDSDDTPVWDIYLATLLVQGKTAKFNEWINLLRQAGTKHINLAISYNYLEPGVNYPYDGQDFTSHLNDFAAVVAQVQSLGFIPIIKLAFDGQGYDPVGWTYGWQWGMDNAASIINQLSQFVNSSLWSTGYDGCFPNWSPTQTVQILQLLRSILGTGCIDTEFGGPGSVGYCHMGNGGADWTPDKLGILDNFSVELNTFPADSNGVQQTAARLLGGQARNIQPPNYLAGQPPSDTNCYLVNAGGKKINICYYETVAFGAIRKQITSAQAIQAAQFGQNFGFSSFGNGQP